MLTFVYVKITWYNITTMVVIITELNVTIY